MSNQLQKAITAIKAGDTQSGREVLYNVLKSDPYNENGWLWLSSTGDQEEATKCLRRVLEINPHNTLAKKRLRQLQSPASAQNGSSTKMTRSQVQPVIKKQHTGLLKHPDQLKSRLTKSTAYSDVNDGATLQSKHRMGNMA